MLWDFLQKYRDTKNELPSHKIPAAIISPATVYAAVANNVIVAAKKATRKVEEVAAVAPPDHVDGRRATKYIVPGNAERCTAAEACLTLRI